jgi:HEPN domain-containing protein
VRAWLLKANHDLDTARQLGALPGGHLDAAIYHCQQAAEKAVKGYLASRGLRLERTHDIERLVSQAAQHEPTFNQWLGAAAKLTPYATGYRYPDGAMYLLPSRTEFETALEQADGIVGLVMSVLPRELLPS